MQGTELPSNWTGVYAQPADNFTVRPGCDRRICQLALTRTLALFGIATTMIRVNVSMVQHACHCMQKQDCRALAYCQLCTSTTELAKASKLATTNVIIWVQQPGFSKAFCTLLYVHLHSLFDSAVPVVLSQRESLCREQPC